MEDTGVDVGLGAVGAFFFFITTIWIILPSIRPIDYKLGKPIPEASNNWSSFNILPLNTNVINSGSTF